MVAPADAHDRNDEPPDVPRPVVHPSDPAYRGQAVYSRGMLLAYDTLVVRLSNTLVWRCPAAEIRALYARHLTSVHLDVGPGTGYYLDHCRMPDRLRLTLLDANPQVLSYAGERLRRYRPAVHTADVLKPISLPPGSFRSIGLSYVLHCVPGDIAAKAVLLDNLSPLLEPGGVVFGATILGEPDRHNAAGRALMRIYNRKGIFANTADTLDDLDRALAGRFARYELTVTGTVALFAAWTA
jgi:SAM-dependent methyltransferase